MKVIRVFIIFILLAGCTESASSSHEYDCSEDKDKGANFILECISNANPKSDEEPEDWIYECENMMRPLYCKKVYGFYLWKGTTKVSGFIKCKDSKKYGNEAVKVCRGNM